MSVRVYVPRDSAALSVGAEGVARAISSEASSRGLDITLVRNGSRGMFWLEPLVEVETPNGRVAYGPVSIEAVAGLFDAGFLEGRNPTRCPSAPPKRFLTSSSRSGSPSFAAASSDPLSLPDYVAPRRLSRIAARAAPDTGGDSHRCHQLGIAPDAAAPVFPTGIQVEDPVLGASSDQKYIWLQRRRGRQRHLRRPNDHGKATPSFSSKA